MKLFSKKPQNPTESPNRSKKQASPSPTKEGSKMARKQPQKSKNDPALSNPKSKRSEEERMHQTPTSQKTEPTTGERLIDYSQKTFQQSSRAATAAEELLGLFSQEQGKSQDDPIQLLQDTLAQLVELQLSNAERLARIEEQLLKTTDKSSDAQSPTEPL